MTNNNNPLRRSDLRTEIASIEVRGIAAHSEDSAHGPFLIFDISDSGLRVWVPDAIKTGDVIKLTIVKPIHVVLSCAVRWCKPAASGGFQLGLHVSDNLARLEALHRAIARLEAGDDSRDDDDVTSP